MESRCVNHNQNRSLHNSWWAIPLLRNSARSRVPKLKPLDPGHKAISTPVYPYLSSKSLLFEGLKKLLCWDYTNIYWALSTRQTPSKLFAYISALNPQKALGGRLTSSSMRKLRPRKVNNIPKSSEPENGSSGVWTQTASSRVPAFLAAAHDGLPNLMVPA